MPTETITHITRNRLMFSNKTGIVTMGTSFDGGFYTGNNYTNKCAGAFHEAMCGIYFPQCSESCVPLKPRKALCKEFEYECGDAGIIIYPFFETYVLGSLLSVSVSLSLSHTHTHNKQQQQQIHLR